MVEDVEERPLRTLLANPLLDIVNDQQVDGLVEVYKIVERIFPHGVCILQFEESGADIEHALLRINLLYTVTDGIDQVRLTASRRSVDEHRIELAALRMPIIVWTSLRSLSNDVQTKVILPYVAIIIICQNSVHGLDPHNSLMKYRLFFLFYR